ncbi:acyl-CoA dehydrogenase family protein [Brevibacillus sp. SYSU BS000544]|uniref:acyl-CoA dehydrogenase family protein n=1 Tax=Brevibacillus sp. SYSU BS000544 TaxID=3416443 RepID=UPI003CE4D4C4
MTIENTYSFQDFYTKRNGANDWDNPFLQQVLQQFCKDGDWAEMQRRVKPFVQKVSTDWRNIASEAARPENQPKLRHYNAFNERIDRIVRPFELQKMEKEIFGHGLFASNQLEKEGIIKRYFLHGNGETGITCPLACTDGLVTLIEQFLEEVPHEVKTFYQHVKEGVNGEFGIGAQYMSEIQGGSNIAANVLTAKEEGGQYRLYGNKFFCSAVHADYSAVTARIENTQDIAIFIVPTWLPGDKEREKRNHHVINRLKWKIGTVELPSAEIDYQGAIAYRIGPQNRGVSLAVSLVLTRSRLDIGFASGAFLMRAAREAKLYARFRTVFDRQIDEFPMASAQLEDLEDAAKRIVGTAFAIYDAFIRSKDNPHSLEGFVARELILLQKVFASKEAVDKLRTAISIFGGHGAIEDFSAIPRLLRDSMVNELWEGPRNVLLAQMYRDIAKMRSKISVNLLVSSILSDYTADEVNRYVEQIEELLEVDITAYPNAKNRLAARKWELIWEEIFTLFQEQTIRDMKDLPISLK